MKDFKKKFKEKLIANFYNGSYLEIHSGDIDDIIEIADNLINKLPETTNGKPKICKHLEKTGRFKGQPYCEVYKGICKCK